MADTQSLLPEYTLGAPLDFLERLWHLNHALERLSSRMVRALGVTAQQRLLLLCVGKYPGITSGQLASMLRLDPGTVSAALKRVEEKGLLQRESDPRDGRRTIVGLTAKGRSVAVSQGGTVEAAVEDFLENTPREQTELALLVLENLTKRILDECHLPDVSAPENAARSGIANAPRKRATRKSA